MPRPVELEVSLIEVSADQMANLAPGMRQDTLSVSSSVGEQNLAAKVAELEQAHQATVLSRSRLIAGNAGEFSWKASDQASMRVRIEPQWSGVDGLTSLRIQPETLAPNDGGNATRRLDSKISLSRNQGAIVSGLLPAEQVGQLREKLTPGASPGGGEVLMIITPVQKK
jgi:hypothetical protein